MAEPAAAEQSRIVEARGLVLSGFPGARPFDFLLRAGELRVLVGPDKCGKSMLLKTILGLVDPGGGEILLLGERLRALSRAGRRRLLARVGTVFEEDGLINAWTVYDNLTLPLFYHDDLPEDVVERRLEDLVRSSGLPREWLPEALTRLHRQQRRYVALLRALIVDPALLLVDGLDSETLHGFAEGRGETLLREQLRRGTAVIVQPRFDWKRVFGDLALALVMENGTLAEANRREHGV
jgi:ABC-type transporter Mla maintaining outer membrane lipid asymmetry ATPase subunit MlaF